jgi:DNA helicase HerA-like ATPase
MDYKPPTPTVMSVFGQPGTGKTCYLRYRLSQQKHPRRVIIVDPFDDIEATIVFHGDLQGAWDFLNSQKPEDEFVLRFKPNPGQHWEATNLLAQAALATGSTLIVDEAHKVAKQHEECEYLLEIARMGRHYNCCVWLASQRPASISRDLTTGGERAFFYTDEPRDLVYVRDTLGKKAAEIVRDLPPLVFLYKHAKIINLNQIVLPERKGGLYKVVKTEDLRIEEIS